MQATLYGLADASCGLSGAAATLVGPTGASAGGQRAPGDDFLNFGRFLTIFEGFAAKQVFGQFCSKPAPGSRLKGCRGSVCTVLDLDNG